MKAKIRIPTEQYAYIEMESEFDNYAAIVNAHNELLGLYQLSKMKKMGADVTADHEKLKEFNK